MWSERWNTVQDTMGNACSSKGSGDWIGAGEGSRRCLAHDRYLTGCVRSTPDHRCFFASLNVYQGPRGLGNWLVEVETSVSSVVSADARG
jgi:hypothetical protein